MNIKIYVANLGKYNEGILQGEWFTLPHDIQDIYVAIGVGQYDEEGNYKHGVEEDGIFYEEFAIHDYEAPFEISEYESINKLNEIAERLQDVNAPVENNYGMYDVEEVINFAYELENNQLINDAHDYIGDIVEGETIDEMVKASIENGDGWERIRFFLSNASMNSDYHLIDGYGNITRLTNQDLSSIVSDLTEEAKRNI